MQLLISFIKAAVLWSNLTYGTSSSRHSQKHFDILRNLLFLLGRNSPGLQLLYTSNIVYTFKVLDLFGQPFPLKGIETLMHIGLVTLNTNQIEELGSTEEAR